MLERLIKIGIECTYIGIHGISYVIKRVFCLY